jgi:hypothetical protein
MVRRSFEVWRDAENATPGIAAMVAPAPAAVESNSLRETFRAFFITLSPKIPVSPVKG